MVWSLRSRIVLAGCGLLGAGGYIASTDPTYTRPAFFWYNMFPIYLHYRAVELKHDFTKPTNPSDLIVWKQKREEAFNNLHDTYSPIALDLILQLRGLYVKFGQVGATRSDFLPLQYRTLFATLFDKVPSLGGEEAKSIINASLEKIGESIDSLFIDFEDESIGSASIVHKAKLRSNGNPVVIKLKVLYYLIYEFQYPDAKPLFETDLKTIKSFVDLAQPELSATINEFSKQFLNEFNFSNEVKSLETIRTNISPYFKNVIIPKPYLELCTPDIIVMEFIPGKNLVNTVMDYYKEYAKSIGKTIDQLQKTYQEQRLIKRDWITQQFYQYSSRIYLLFHYYYSFIGVYLFNHTFRQYKRSFLEYPVPIINGYSLLETLINVHGHQIFINGIFNADPHPGNILYCPDTRIGLIDYGQVKTLTREQIRTLSHLIISIADHDYEKVVSIAKEMGFTTKRNDPTIILQTVQMSYDSNEVATQLGN